MLIKMDPEIFDWLLWRNGSPADIFKENQWYANISDKKNILIHFAVGYCDGDKLFCRPKDNHKAVMFLVKEKLFWFHLTDEEFKEVFHET